MSPVILSTTDFIIYELSQVMPETNVDVVGSTKQSALFLDPKTVT